MLTNSNIQTRINGRKNPIKDITGATFGRLTILSFSHQNKHGVSCWNCRCTCGNEKIISKSHLTSGDILSCGCLNFELRGKRNITHGLTKTHLYKVWIGIRARCYGINSTPYSKYGGKGIKVCEEWNDFPSFKDWATINGWQKGLNVCRKGDAGDYSPDNCYIATSAQNQRDKKNLKLNMWKARVIRVMDKNHGWSQKKQADFWGVNQNTISYVVNNRSWI